MITTNIVITLRREILRVRELLPKLDPPKQREAKDLLIVAEDYLQQNFLEGMYQAVDDLGEFEEPE